MCVCQWNGLLRVLHAACVFTSFRTIVCRAWRLGAQEEEVLNLCFLSAFAYSMLHYGHGFDLERNFTAVKSMMYEGVPLQVGWQLGSVLYEINAIPWECLDCNDRSSPAKEQTMVLSVSLAVIALCLVAVCILAYRYREARMEGTSWLLFCPCVVSCLPLVG